MSVEHFLMFFLFAEVTN